MATAAAASVPATTEDDRMRAILLECSAALKTPDAPAKIPNISISLRAIQGTITSLRFALTHSTQHNVYIHNALHKVYEANYILSGREYLDEYTKRVVFNFATSAAGFIDGYLSSGVFPAPPSPHKAE